MWPGASILSLRSDFAHCLLTIAPWHSHCIEPVTLGLCSSSTTFLLLLNLSLTLFSSLECHLNVINNAFCAPAPMLADVTLGVDYRDLAVLQGHSG